MNLAQAKSGVAACAIAVSLVWALVVTEKAANRQLQPGKTTVVYWEKWDGDEEAAMRKLVDAFNKSQDKIDVEMLSISAITDKTLLATAGGDPPDIAGLWSDQVAQFADENALDDLTQLAAESGVHQADYIPAYWREMTYKGRLYALPTTPGTSALYVNRDLVPPEYSSPETFPKTLAEFNKMVTAMTAKSKSGGLQRVGFLPRNGFGGNSWDYLFGGSIVDGNGGATTRPDVDSPADVAAWTWVHSFAAGYGLQQTQVFQTGFGSYSSSQNPFLIGKLVCQMDGPWFANFIRLYNPRLHWFVVPFPSQNAVGLDHAFTVLNLNTMMIPKGAKHPKEAFQFMAFVQKQANMEQLCHDQFCNSPLSHVSQAFIANHPNKDIALFNKLAFSSGAVGREHIGIYGQIMDELTAAGDEMDLGQATPAAALKAAQTRLEGEWKHYQEQVLDQ